MLCAVPGLVGVVLCDGVQLYKCCSTELFDAFGGSTAGAREPVDAEGEEGESSEDYAQQRTLLAPALARARLVCFLL